MITFLICVIAIIVALLIYAGTIVIAGFGGIWSDLQLHNRELKKYLNSSTKTRREELKEGWDDALKKLKSITKISFYLIIFNLLIIAFLSTYYVYGYIFMIMIIFFLCHIFKKFNVLIEKVLDVPEILMEDNNEEKIEIIKNL